MSRMRRQASSSSVFQAAALAAVMIASALPLAAVLSSLPQNVLVAVQPELYGEVCAELDAFSEALAADGYSVKIEVGRWQAAEALRETIAYAWTSLGIVGCILVGQMPSMTYEMWGDSTVGGGLSTFPIDLYFEDLDGAWTDSDGNGALDGHEAGDGDLAPEIWLGRLALRTERADEADLIKAYLERDAAYRRGEMRFPEGALLYIDDDWTKDLYAYKHGLSYVYDSVDVASGKKVTNASDYAARLAEGHEWVQVHSHVSLDGTAHAFAMDDGEDNDGDGTADEGDEGGEFGPDQMANSSMASGFYNVFTCAAGDYTRLDFVCGWYALAGSGLCAIGSTKEGAMLNFNAFYGPIGDGASIGDAFRSWMSSTAEDWFGREARNVSRSWFYGMTIIGDPTLHLVRETPEALGAAADTPEERPRP